MGNMSSWNYRDYVEFDCPESAKDFIKDIKPLTMGKRDPEYRYDNRQIPILKEPQIRFDSVRIDSILIRGNRNCNSGIYITG